METHFVFNKQYADVLDTVLKKHTAHYFIFDQNIEFGRLYQDDDKNSNFYGIVIRCKKLRIRYYSLRRSFLVETKKIYGGWHKKTAIEATSNKEVYKLFRAIIQEVD